MEALSDPKVCYLSAKSHSGQVLGWIPSTINVMTSYFHALTYLKKAKLFNCIWLAPCTYALVGTTIFKNIEQGFPHKATP